MTESGFRRYQCWDERRIGEVINKEAVSVEPPEFMATHGPISDIRYLRSPSAIASTSESGLLDELLRSAQESRHAFVVIQGIPGTGKSHLIRWLQRRYQAESQGNEVVLLIERAQNSLLGTLRQLIDKVDFADEGMRQQLAKLKGAAESLSDRALADSIVDNLRVATYERPLPPGERLNSRIRNNIEHFLLDPVVRDELKRPEGPVERITRFLAAGGSAPNGDGRPQFVAEDFDLRPEVLRAIRDEGLREARELADGLNIKAELRVELARYLNRLLDYAISRTVVLSGDDLKQIFNDLRRHLRRQGKSLVLFIEDITAFTGIDNGLIDGLATQHTGEANRDFCRLASVVGITDGYYHDRFPDNMRDRVTHHLSLNAQTSGPPESDLLRSPQTTADLAARYLNAMRVSHGDLAVWLAGGGRIDNIPNRCDGCPFRAPCHAAFGAVDITAGSAPAPVEVGLYPFNAQALWTMYRQIDSASTSRTPRALLNSVLLYVMQSHAHKVAEGQFPPPPNDLGNDFRPPPPAKPIQQRTIDTQAGRDARRVEALALFWGDRTVDAIGERESRTVGGLPSAVFHAFDAPFIDGEAASAAPPGTVLPPRDIVLPPPDTVLPPSDPTPPPPPRGTRYDEAIAPWRAGGRLSQFEDLRRFLSYFIQSSIDWQGHGVPANIVDERLRPPRLRI
ncbi:MAG TPA: hypothetical protein VLA19_12805, partial [Herpetosiphonaceae bacterium]|nr:hypothetical protein [Herpetosiphonaceae bacterium]